MADEKEKVCFTVIPGDPEVEEIAELFRQLKGRDLTEEEMQEIQKSVAEDREEDAEEGQPDE
jgi:hypothetical protein